MNPSSSRALLEKAVENSAKSAKEGRLIVRNVGFNVTKGQIQERFQDYGEIVEVSLPPSKRTNPVAEDGRRMKVPAHAGYAFVEFDTREEAQTAIDAINGSRLSGRAVAVDFAYDSRLYLRLKKGEVRPESEDAPDAKKVKVVETVKEAAKQVEVKRTEVKSVKQVEVKQVEVKQVEAKQSEVKSVKPATPVEAKSIKPVKLANSEKSVKGDDDRKVFLLNVPFDAERGDVVAGLCAFGNLEASDIESVLFVSDKEKQRTGRAFVVLKTARIMQSLIDLEIASMPQMFGDMYQKQQASAPIEGCGCWVNGRKVSILKSMSRSEVEKQNQAKEAMEKPGAPKVVNRKFMNLINAGWIGPDQESVWAELSPIEQRMRTAANEEKKFKLNNPNYVVNSKRITIRNIPKTMSNGDLKVAIIRAMKITGSKKAKKAGILRVAIVKDKIESFVDGEGKVEPTFDMNIESDDEEEKSTEGKMKIKKKSRGFGFVDFADSDRALTCLESMNNVIGGFGEMSKRRPIVEFSFDDIRKLQIQQTRKDKEIQAKVRARAEAGPVKKTNGMHPIKLANKTKTKKLGRGQKQRLARKDRREAKEGVVV